ncbi:MAG: hypothetical protein CMG69_03820 [Candidatus Marinimicrobia bacterium]|nr:hypothetical protein [Candidatus Neomarinimicrobiota bacterium]|tara:strand:+ start:439 stop:1224 length:786 start_codon:yes stop_codon:yes gene_type:complete
MKILILTQDDNLYIPDALAKVCNSLNNSNEKIVCIVSSPAMSTHGGVVKGIWNHIKLFGFRGTSIMIFRIIRNKILENFSTTNNNNFSLRSVAAKFNIAFHRIKIINCNDFHLLIDKYSPDILVSLSCPQIIGKKVRNRFPMGCINVHGSPLPRYRGLMPSFWVLRNEESVTAVTVHDLTAKLDDGDILAQREVPISPEDTWDSLVKKTKAVGAIALIDTIRNIKNNSVKRMPNLNSKASYYSFPTSKDRKVFLSLGRLFF